MIILSVIRAKLRIVFENIPACEEISHLLSLCLSHASWYNGTKRQKLFQTSAIRFSDVQRTEKSICAKRKISLSRLIFVCAEKKIEFKEKHNTFINKSLQAVSISSQTVFKALRPYRLFQSRTTALHHRQCKPTQRTKNGQKEKTGTEKPSGQKHCA